MSELKAYQTKRFPGGALRVSGVDDLVRVGTYVAWQENPTPRTVTSASGIVWSESDNSPLLVLLVEALLEHEDISVEIRRTELFISVMSVEEVIATLEEAVRDTAYAQVEMLQAEDYDTRQAVR